MTVIGEAFIAVKPDAKGFGPEAEKGVLGSVSGIAKKAAGILAGAFVVQKGFDFLGSAVSAARESNKVAAQTEAAIKSTGAAAHVTAGQVGELATAISNKTGVDDEAIQSASNLLLTFTNVRNEAGKGNDIFNQATSTLTDMAAALGTDVSGSAIQLGKALNDPISGITALTRVGVTFSDQQKEQIKNFVDQGKVAEAQKVILAELNKEFGGSAAAQATAADRLKVTLGNLQEQIGNALVPVLDKVATFLADNLPRAMAVAGRAFDFFKGLVQLVVAVWNDPDVTSTGWVGTVERVVSAARKAFDALRPVMVKVAEFVQRNLRPILIGLGAAFLLLTSPITAVVAALVIAYAKFQVVRDVVAIVVKAVQGIIKVFGDLADYTADVWPQVAEAVSHAVNVVRDVIGAVVAVVQALWRTFGSQVLQVTQAVWNQIRAVIELAINTVANVIRLVLAIINGDWGKAWDALKGIVGGAWQYVQDTVRNGLAAVRAILGAAVTAIAGALDGAWDGLKRGARGAVDAIGGFFRDLPGNIVRVLAGGALAFLGAGAAIAKGIVAGFAAAFGALGDVVSAVTGEIRDIVASVAKGLINGVIDALNKMLPDSIGKISVAGHTIFPGLDLPDNPIPRLASGALVRATPGGILATLGEGGRDEAVVPLPPGLVPALEAIAGGQLGGPRIQVVEAVSARRTAYEVVAEMRNAEFQRTGVWD